MKVYQEAPVHKNVCLCVLKNMKVAYYNKCNISDNHFALVCIVHKLEELTFKHIYFICVYACMCICACYSPKKIVEIKNANVVFLVFREEKQESR